MKSETLSDSTTVRTMCPMNCHPTLCGMLAEVKDGKLLSVRGDPANPDSQGFLCIRGQASKEIFDNPTRLMFPLVRDRRDAPFRRASAGTRRWIVLPSVSSAPLQAPLHSGRATARLPATMAPGSARS